MLLFAHTAQSWYALPLIVSISLVYAATRHEEMRAILNHALWFGVKITGFFAVLGMFLWWIGKGL
jgi:hypothetical protein